MNKLVAEFIGTFLLVFAGCGSAVISGGHMDLMGIAFTFGLVVMAMAFSIGHISGCHLNPAVTVGLTIAGRARLGDLPGYIIAQVLGAITGAALLVIVAGDSGHNIGSLAANGYGALSPGGYSMTAALVMEVVTTFFFLLIITGSTDARAPQGLAPIAIGLGLAMLIMASGPVANASLNPARSTGPAVFAGGAHLGQLWLFWVAPIVGGALGGLFYKNYFAPKPN